MATTWVSVNNCRRCGTRWKETSTKPISLDDPPPTCPNLNCGVELTPIGMDIASGVAPAIGGTSIHNKAIDETARIVMHDYGLTDLRDDVRPTETMAPKLPPKQQAAADGFFGAGKARGRGPNGMPFNPATLAARALSGGLRDSVSVARTMGALHRPEFRGSSAVPGGRDIVPADRTARR